MITPLTHFPTDGFVGSATVVRCHRQCDAARANECEVIGDGEPKCACDSDPLANENPHCP
jgi:hypothetical protein